MSEIQKAVVAFSGGQDSTTCLAWAIERWGRENVHAVSFDYGQRHRVELECADRLLEHFGIAPERRVRLSLPAFRELGAAALTTPKIEVRAAEDVAGSGNEHAERAGLPSTFVPGRNLVFLGLVAAYAAQHDISNMVTGVCYADEAGYPDCRPQFIEAFAKAAGLAMGVTELYVHTPLMFIDKARTFQLADDLGALDVIITGTHTCYEGDHETLHEWGYGCGQCPACEERRKGWDGYVARLGEPVASVR